MLRLATPGDLDHLLALEQDCFDPDRRDTRETIRNSLRNAQHETWIGSEFGDHRIGAALFLRKTRKTLRVYSLSTHPDLRGQGWGNHLLAFAYVRAQALNCNQMSLEVDAAHPELVDWYARKGFIRTKFLESYYETGRHAWRMKCPVSFDS